MRASPRICICTRPTARRQPPRWLSPPCGAPHATPAGPLTGQAIEGFRRSAAADAPARRGQARGLTAEECAAVLATCGRPRRTGRGHRARRDGRAPRPRRRRDRGVALSRGRCAAARWRLCAGPTSSSPTLATSASPLEDDSGRRSSRRSAPGRRLRGRGGRLQAATAPDPGDSVIRLGVDQVNRRFAGRLRRGRPRGLQNLAQRPRGTRRRAHRPRGRHPRHPARRRLEGRQHGGTLCRLGRHPRRRQPLHAMKERPARAAGGGEAGGATAGSGCDRGLARPSRWSRRGSRSSSGTCSKRKRP